MFWGSWPAANRFRLLRASLAATLFVILLLAASAIEARADPVIAAAGDIACSPSSTVTSTKCHQGATSDLLVNAGLSAVLPLGDAQYASGSYSSFTKSYAPTWGRVLPITFPAAGNHEYLTSGAKGYFDYFNGVGAPTGRAGDRDKGYYSFDVGTWHVVVLNTECTRIDNGAGCAVGSLQEQWLRSDLTASGKPCTLAVGHRPRWSSNSFASSDIAPLVDVLYAHRVEVYLSGHSHGYERFAPQNPAGARDDAAGIREFVVGTGGRDSSGFGTVASNSEIRKNKLFGVMKLTLGATGYGWSYLPDPSTPFADSGQMSCN
jgi:hypothetical protein